MAVLDHQVGDGAPTKILSRFTSAGYPPAYDHEGSPVVALTDGRVLRSLRDQAGGIPVTGTVLGWRPGCGCGWTGKQLAPRAE